MKAGKACIELVKKYEGCRLVSYKCPADVWTIGYGHTGGVKEGQRITQEQAERYLEKDLEKFEKLVMKYWDKYRWTQNEFDALVSFAYNIGSIDKLTANGTRDRATIAEKVPAYNKINGKVHAGLSKRRREEQGLFLGGRAQGSGSAEERATVKKGSRGEDVEFLQKYLKGKGYYIGEADGIFGGMMEKAVKLFQNDAGLAAADGIVGKKTWEKVEENPELRIGVFSSSRDGNKKISAGFSVKEFRCKDGSDSILVDAVFVRDKLQRIRDHFGVPVTVNSGFRTISYNKKVGGASSSYHLYGRAFDVTVKGHMPEEVAKYAQTLGINGIIQYNGFVHLDSRPTKYWARNDNGKVVIKNSF